MIHIRLPRRIPRQTDMTSSSEPGWSDPNTENRHEKFRCVYARPDSSSACDSDSVPFTDKSDSDRVEGISSHHAISDADSTRHDKILEELRQMRNEIETIKERQLQTLHECVKLSKAFLEMKKEITEIKGEREGSTESKKNFSAFFRPRRRKKSDFSGDTRQERISKSDDEL